MEIQKHMNLIKDSAILFFVLLLVSCGGLVYGYYRYTALTKAFAQANQTIRELEDSLTNTEQQRDTISNQLLAEKSTNESFQGQIASISSTVGTLQKLKETDPQLLQKYSKVYFLNENYLPSKLVAIDKEFVFNKEKTLQFHANAERFLNNMFAKASSEGIHLKIISSYRSFDEQAGLKSSYKVTYGLGANKFSADQGYSEHQLGTALDLTTPEVGATFVGFEKSPEYAWLVAHAHEYGFILSYPKENTFYQFEPWHWRFVGTALAQRLHNENKRFYDLEQRDIDTYLVNLFD
jgi:LAS superfamily LD-carboxypeptidase LdcB